MPTPELHRGAIARQPRILSVRPLVREDLAALRGRRVGPARLKTFRDTHHRVARLCAAGLRPSEIMRRTGYAANRLNQLQTDPAFQQLVAEYRLKVDEAFINSLDEFYETATSNMLRAERMIEEHLDAAEEGEAIGLKTLALLVADRADRFGYGKHRTQTNENVNFAAQMKEIAQRSGRSNVIDARPNSSPEADPGPQSRAVLGFKRRV